MATAPLYPERAVRPRLLRQLEAALRKDDARTDIRRDLQRLGMTVDEIHRYELGVRRRIKDERKGARRQPA